MEVLYWIVNCNSTESCSQFLFIFCFCFQFNTCEKFTEDNLSAMSHGVRWNFYIAWIVKRNITERCSQFFFFLVYHTCTVTDICQNVLAHSFKTVKTMVLALPLFPIICASNVSCLTKKIMTVVIKTWSLLLGIVLVAFRLVFDQYLLIFFTAVLKLLYCWIY